MALCLWKSAAGIGAAALLCACQLVSGLDGLEASGGAGGVDMMAASSASGSGGAGGGEPCPKEGCKLVFIDNTIVAVSHIATDGAYLYWANRGGAGSDGSIWRVPLDLGQDPVVVATSLRPQGLVHDSTSNVVLWPDIAGGLHRIRYVSAEAEDGSPMDFSTAINNQSVWRSLAKSPNNTFFWVDATAASIHYGGFQAAQGVFSGIGMPYSLAADETRVYWFDGVGIAAAGHDGNNKTPLASAGGAAYGIAIDAKYLYWTERTMSGKLLGISKEMPATPATIANDLSFPTHVFSDEVNVYWVNEGGLLCDTSSGKVLRAPAGLLGGPYETLASDLRCPSNLVQAGGYVYWGSGKRIFRVSAQP